MNIIEWLFGPKWGYKSATASIYDRRKSIFTKPQHIYIDDYARIDGAVKIEGGIHVGIGKHVHISSFCHINAGGGRVLIKDHAGCSSGVKIVAGHPDLGYRHLMPTECAGNVHSVRKTTTIGEYSVIFAGATICAGVSIGKYCIIDAGAVVTHDVPDYEVWSGCPAHFRYIRDRNNLK